MHSRRKLERWERERASWSFGRLGWKSVENSHVSQASQRPEEAVSDRQTILCALNRAQFIHYNNPLWKEEAETTARRAVISSPLQTGTPFVCESVQTYRIDIFVGFTKSVINSIISVSAQQNGFLILFTTVFTGIRPRFSLSSKQLRWLYKVSGWALWFRNVLPQLIHWKITTTNITNSVGRCEAAWIGCSQSTRSHAVSCFL